VGEARLWTSFSDGRVRRRSARGTACRVELSGTGHDGDWAGSFGNSSQQSTVFALRLKVCPTLPAYRY